MSTQEDLLDFEEQLRLQNLQPLRETSKTRVDPDGTVMEWDDRRKAWFPKMEDDKNTHVYVTGLPPEITEEEFLELMSKYGVVMNEPFVGKPRIKLYRDEHGKPKGDGRCCYVKIDDDFIARYQMSYGVTANYDESSIKTATAPAASDDGCMNWSSFNAQLSKLREEKGEQSEEVQALTRAAHESLTAYYNSPAYKEWYASYCKQQEKPKEDAKIVVVQPKSIKSNKLRTDLKPSERVRQALANDGEDAEMALARAEAEQQAGVPLCIEQDATNVQSDQSHEVIDNKSGDSNASKPAAKRKQAAPPPAWYEMEDDKNTHVYVTGLPPEITEEEFLELMSKYGVVMNEPFVGKPRIKLYRDEHGKPKGDGRCCYVKVESVELALKILDGMVYTPGYTLHVERAKFQPKGTFDPKKRRRLTLKEKKKLKEQQENLFRWSIDTSKFVRSKKERVLVLKNAFLEHDFVTNPLGIVTVTFNSPEEADTALGFLDKALFNYPGSGGARQLLVERWDGKTNYSVKEDKDEELSRIHNWEKFLGGNESSSDESDELQEKDAEIQAGMTAHERPEEADTALGFLDKALFNYPGSGGARQLLVERWDGKTNYSVKEDKDEELSRIHNWEKFLGGNESSSDESDELQEKDAEIQAGMTAHERSEASTELAADYWETSSQESPISQTDTDEAGGSSGDETACLIRPYCSVHMYKYLYLQTFIISLLIPY
ncbi:hypothetical protein AHF37_04272 [Paragonimus kellicotti]|nr:hypothetical protein AHF37_04272 [Paragonimus kellicotti]